MRVIDQNGENAGTVPRRTALAMAQEAWLDLVQISYNPKDKVSTAKIVDFGKRKYDKQKAEKKKKQNQKQKWQKEIKFWYNIWDHDLDMKLDKAKEFLEDWYVVKIMVVLRGREKAYKPLVRKKMEYAKEYLEKYGKPQWIREEHFGFLLVLLNKK